MRIRIYFMYIVAVLYIMMNIRAQEMADEVTDECKEGFQKPSNALLELHPLFAIHCRRK